MPLTPRALEIGATDVSVFSSARTRTPHLPRSRRGGGQRVSSACRRRRARPGGWSSGARRATSRTRPTPSAMRRTRPPSSPPRPSSRQPPGMGEATDRGRPRRRPRRRRTSCSTSNPPSGWGRCRGTPRARARRPPRGTRPPRRRRRRRHRPRGTRWNRGVVPARAARRRPPRPPCSSTNRHIPRIPTIDRAPGVRSRTRATPDPPRILRRGGCASPSGSGLPRSRNFATGAATTTTRRALVARTGPRSNPRPSNRECSCAGGSHSRRDLRATEEDTAAQPTPRARLCTKR